ncbi:UDP-N-acetylglucosamine 2-epimerase [Temperatibacter marinus]|uniref:UDP-N-acetylglucosamine 2-epimerase n=1 Tax=Temperatibacter marinus TaxID=1456591 RepID=A0AA52EHF3_9PROT|nr:UDP-N-acetylglucosamine 2-epimerase [Temperatibacter marinus]WND02569.1 UDP-N-acetylglucosamine 2-epimerase [Temperatibacter marinus]
MTEANILEEGKKRVVFLTGTRADFGKLKSLISILQQSEDYEVHLFVTGMHMLQKYGYTCSEVEKSGFRNLFKYINQNEYDSMDAILGKTISGLSDYVKEIQPDMIIVHGDRLEALAGAAVGALSNVRVGHIEGGEISGTIDETLRHAVTKLSGYHFVANAKAKLRLMQLGEEETAVHVIGSPDMDIMRSDALPSLEEVKQRYDITFQEYGILLYHPVTTETSGRYAKAMELVSALKESGKNYIVIYPNNDLGADRILEAYKEFEGHDQFKIFPSMRFEYFLSLMKQASFMVGNSSSGVMEAPYFGVPAIDIGSRQSNRAQPKTLLKSQSDKASIMKAITQALEMPREAESLFGEGGSDQKFKAVLDSESLWHRPVQKQFVDLINSSL